jgi:hypothetical protein
MSFEISELMIQLAEAAEQTVPCTVGNTKAPAPACTSATTKAPAPTCKSGNTKLPGEIVPEIECITGGNTKASAPTRGPQAELETVRQELQAKMATIARRKATVAG